MPGKLAAAKLNRMRLFTGIAIPEDLVDNLARLVDRLRPTAHIAWSAVYNFHITTKFIGEWPEHRLAEVVHALQQLPARPPLLISLTGVGWFPNPHAPRVLWAGVKAEEKLAQLAGDTDEALHPLGVPRETRRYSPHLTLARIRDTAVPLAPLRQAIAQLSSIDFGEFTAEQCHLYLSEPGPSGTIYTQLAEIRFASK